MLNVGPQSVDLPCWMSESVAASLWPVETRDTPSDSEEGGEGLPGSLHLSGHHLRPALLHRPGGGSHDGLPLPGLLAGGEGRPGPLQAGGLSGAQLLLPALTSSSTPDLDTQWSPGRLQGHSLSLCLTFTH